MSLRQRRRFDLRSGDPGSPDDRDWTPRLAESLARSRGIVELTDRHWRVITLCREDAARFGQTPGLERIRDLSDLSDEDLQLLFPGEPAVTVALLSGLGPSGEETPSTRMPREDLP